MFKPWALALLCLVAGSIWLATSYPAIRTTGSQPSLVIPPEADRDQWWVAIRLGRLHTMTVYQGRMPVRLMLASGGRPQMETPPGTYFLQDRGQSFWSSRFNEGATYWVRLKDQYLIHSVPRDAQWEVKEDQHSLLGLPASHGCVRLAEPDARWFWETVPQGTKVLIYVPVRSDR